MSVDRCSLIFLAHSKASGVSFSRAATIGRQGLAASARDVRRALSSAGRDPGAAATGRWIEPVLAGLGAEQVVSVDVSDYEGATLVHDLNLPIAAELEAKFSVVIDVGTLEHVFDFPTAIRNLMRMVEVGGHLLLVTPTNNEAGHGFYQFSPELLFRVLSPQYGFDLEEMLIREPGRSRSSWYRVSDPGLVGRRAQFRSRAATYLFIRARRIGTIPEFTPPPQQSDYATAWRSGSFADVAGPRWGAALRPVRRLARLLSGEGTVPSRALTRALSGPLGWARQLRLFRRPRYRRLPSHFSRIGGGGLPARYGDRPHGDRPHSGRPRGGRPRGGRPRGGRPHGIGPGESDGSNARNFSPPKGSAAL